IFIGQDKIIHFVNPKIDGKLGLSASSSVMKTPACPISYCGTEKVAGGGVRMTCIDCFIRNGSLYRYKYQAQRAFVRVKLIRGGTCTTKMSDPPEEVIHRATYLHENGYEEYSLRNNNCEDFALYCKTGLVSIDISHQGRSSQVNRLLPSKGWI
ncbi:protein LEAD-SENSITIVE 1-like, partial [Bidens hawaiensis]|uniref:protein LEAD-SENSITIVE 1-like n=1 Tax=Bidens hawaiensis TaxID=980011 RepID=UPI00404B9514